MKRVLLATATALALTACGGTADSPATSSAATSAGPSSSTAVPAPTVPTGGGLGEWTYRDDSQVVSVGFNATDPVVKAAESCRVAMKAAPVVWVLISSENLTGAAINLNTVTIVTGDGAQVKPDNAVSTLGDWYASAPDSPGREACVATAGEVAKAQIEGGIAPGAKVAALHSVPVTVTTVKSVTANGAGGRPITLAYSS